MKRLTWILLSFVMVGVALAWESPDSPSPDGTVNLAGAQWGSNFERAKQQARASGKPILLFDMVGRLDEQWC